LQIRASPADLDSAVHFGADLDPTFFTCMQIWIQLFMRMCILIKVMRICNITDFPLAGMSLHGSSLSLHGSRVSPHGSRVSLHGSVASLSAFHFINGSDLYPVFHFDANPASHNYADPDVLLKWRVVFQ
jgi:hypothetical protein